MRGWVILSIFLLLGAVPGVHAIAELDDRSPVELTAPGSDAPWARALVEQLPRATAVNDGDGDKLWDGLEERYAASGGAPLPVVVTFTHATATEEGLEQVRRVVPDLDPVRAFTIIPAFAAELSLDQALRLASLDVVRQVEHDRPGTPELDTATAVMGVDHVQASLGVTGDREGNETVYTPEDVVVAVLDTGFHGEHADLDDGKILHFADLANGQEEAYDAGSHGTHVAGIAVGTGDGDPAYTGVAPGAGMVGIKIVDSEAECLAVLIVTAVGCTGESSLSLAIQGFEWIVENKETYGIDVATISFGFGTATDGTSALELAVDQAWEAGVVVFKSTGNGGPERRTITVPAAARGIIATGAMLDPNGVENPGGLGPLVPSLSAGFGFQLASFSSRGPTTDGRVKPDLTAPGVSIMAAEAGTDEGYVAFSGTSMASPFAAGTAALVLDANPQLTPDQVREVLTGTTEDWGLEGDDVDYGWGRLQPAQAVARALAMAGHAPNATAPEVPFHEARAGTLLDTGTDDPTLPGTAETTIEVTETENPLAVTAIVEGKLAHLSVEDPAGNLVVSWDPFNAVARQHVVGFQPTETGTYTIRLGGEVGAPWVLDVSHGSAGGLPIELPTGVIEEIETAQTPDRQAGVPLPAWLGLVALSIAGLVAGRRR